MNACVRTSPLALLVPLVVAAGCSSSSSKHERAVVAPAVPWIAAKPAQVAEREPVARACRAADLEPPKQVKFVPRLRGGVALVPLRQHERPCVPAHRPAARRLREGRRTRAGREARSRRRPRTFPRRRTPPRACSRCGRASRATSRSRGTTGATPSCRDSPTCRRARCGSRCRRAAGASTRTTTRCRRASTPTRRRRSASRSSSRTSSRTGRPWTNAFLRATVPGQPVHARRGAVLRFRVVLHNASRTTVRFDRCPAYAQQLVPRGSVEAYTLNCRAAHRDRAGQEPCVRDAVARAAERAARRERALLGARPVRRAGAAGSRARDDRPLPRLRRGRLAAPPSPLRCWSGGSVWLERPARKVRTSLPSGLPTSRPSQPRRSSRTARRAPARRTGRPPGRSRAAAARSAGRAPGSRSGRSRSARPAGTSPDVDPSPVADEQLDVTPGRLRRERVLDQSGRSSPRAGCRRRSPSSTSGRPSCRPSSRLKPASKVTVVCAVGFFGVISK